VLRGKLTERIVSSAHDKQSTFGIGKDLDEQQWSSVFRQLVARGLVSVNFDHFGVLQLTDACRAILRGEQRLILRKDIKPEKSKPGKKSASRSFSKGENNIELWDALRAKRREIADAQDVPPYVIFHDATLMTMLETRPTNLKQMALISGVGVRKLELYGDQFLAVISDYVENHKDHDTVTESADLFKLGYSVQQIAQKRELKEETIYNHLSQALEQGKLVLHDVVGLPDQEIKRIEEAILSLPEEQQNALKPVYELFDGRYSYGILRCVRAALQCQVA
jgi:ATP-dependent DNA helicase RecQ